MSKIGVSAKPRIREYRPGTFDRHVAYGQRDRKLSLVARGIILGFKVVCGTEKAAQNLAHAFRVRAPRIEAQESARFDLKVKLEGRKVYVFRTKKSVG